MTTFKHHMQSLARNAGCAALAILLTGIAHGQAGSSGSTWQPGNVQNQAWPSNSSQSQAIRGSDFIGTDLVSSDGRKLGDIVDFVFDTSSQAQRLAYVLVMSGGFLDLGGQLRAVPAEAVAFSGDTAWAKINFSRFMQVPEIKGDREQFLSRPENLSQLSQYFGTRDNRMGQGSYGSRFVTYSSMSRRDALSQNGERIGFINDVWITSDRNRAPFIEITPTVNPFSAPGPQRFAIPMAKLQNAGQNSNRYTFQLSMDELNNARSVADTPGTQMLNDAFAGNTVLRITVPTVASIQESQIGAGAPTGYPSSQSYGSPASVHSSSSSSQSSTYATTSFEQLRQVAQQIRSALDNDSSLRQANIQVLPQNDRIVLAGSVGSDWLRERVQDIAKRMAQGTNVENQVQVYQGQ